MGPGPGLKGERRPGGNSALHRSWTYRDVEPRRRVPTQTNRNCKGLLGPIRDIRGLLGRLRPILTGLGMPPLLGLSLSMMAATVNARDARPLPRTDNGVYMGITLWPVLHTKSVQGGSRAN